MGVETQQVLGHGLFRAATRALNLCFAGVVATSSAVMHSWPLFGASVVGYATLVAWDLTRLGFWTRVLKDLRTRPPALPDGELFSDSGARHFLNRLHQARGELKRVVGGMHGALPPRILTQLESLPEVEKRALLLIARLEELSRYLCDKNVRGLRNEVDRLHRAAENTLNDRLRGEYERAQFALRGELAALEEIAAAKDLLMAKLETVTAALEMFPCEIVRLRVMEADVREHAEIPFDPRAIVADTHTLQGVIAALGLPAEDGEPEPAPGEDRRRPRCSSES
jgi:hypothetical protein